MPSVKVENLSVSAGDTLLVGPISFRIDAGEVLVIMGETGAGKSLLAQAILGALPAGLSAKGAIWLDGARIDDLSATERSALWGHRIAMLPQEPWRALDPLMAAAPQVAESYRYVAGRKPAAARDAAHADFKTLGLSGAEQRLPGALSGGMAQRVAFAAARAGGAPVLIADEPTKGLDPARRNQVGAMLTRVAAEGGTLLAITHEVALARQLGGRIMVLRHGSLVEDGPTVDVLETPQTSYTRALLDADPSRWPERTNNSEGECVLSAEALSVERGGRKLFEGFDLSLCAGERVAISGPSGSGKTSLLDTLAGLRTPSSGQVSRSRSVTANGVQKLYQDPPAAFPPSIRLGQVLRDVARLHGVDWSVITGLLDRLSVNHGLLNRRPASVSGGELQRIALVRALCVSPQVLLADEPTSRLDPITQRETMDVIAEVAAERNIAVLLVTHTKEIADRWAERHLRLSEAGRIATAQAG